MLRSTFVISTLLAVAGATSVAADIPGHGHPDIRRTTHGVLRTPGIRVWTSGDDLHRRGDRVRVYYRTERDAFVMIFRVDTDGRIRLLFPRRPDEENYGYAGATYSVNADESGSAFYVDDDPGVGYIFGVASVDPFDVRDIAYDGQWDLHGVSDGRIHGDPRSSMEEMVQLLLPPDYGNFDTHLLPYYVERRYDYPRFICYDCHTRTPYAYWDPYSAWCRSYTLTVFNDPYYYYPSYWYPTWYYGGTRVVYAQPGGSRYVFKNRGNSAAPGIDYRDRRNTSRTVAARSPESRGVRGIDIGGTGSVPAPRTPMRREAPPLENGGGERPRERGTVDNDPRRSGSGSNQQPGNQAPDGSRRRGEAQPGIQIVPRSESRPDGRADGRPDGRADGMTEARPARPEPRTDGRVDGRTDGRTEARPEVRPSRQPEAKPEARPESREARPQSQEARPAAREARPESRPESRPEARPQERQPSAPQASPPRESRPEPKPQAQPQSRGSDPGLVRRRP